MTSHWRRPLAAFATLAVCVAVLHADFPKPLGAVNDFAEVMSEEQEATLTALLEKLEQDTTAEVAVATVTTLDGMSVEEYANRLFAEWGIGRRGKDNGVLILVAPGQREMRIEVGYGLEGVLPDGLAGEVIRANFLPSFRDNNYGAGIVSGTRRVADIITRNQVVTAEELAALERAANPAAASWIMTGFLALFVGVGAIVAGTGIGARTIMPAVFGLIFSGLPMFMSLLILTPLQTAVLCIVGIAVLVLGVRMGRKPGYAAGARGKATPGQGGKWVWGARRAGDRPAVRDRRVRRAPVSAAAARVAVARADAGRSTSFAQSGTPRGARPVSPSTSCASWREARPASGTRA